MSSTNKTANYELSQFVGSDKPTFLGDYNGDMAKLDTAIKNNSDSASQAQTKANQAYNLAGQAEVKAETADGKAVTAGTTATQALAKALENEASINKFDLINIVRTGYGSMTTNAGTLTQGAITVASNSDNSLAKIYGRIKLTNSGQTSADNKIRFPSSLRPEEDINITALGFEAVDTTNLNGVEVIDITIKTDGTIEIPVALSSSITSVVIVLHPCLLFIKNFGD